MVTVVDYKSATNADNEKFFLLIVQGGLESIQSKETGRFYFTAKKATVSSTFNEATCQSLIGSKLPGGIERESVDAYTYTNEETGEQFELSHRNVYNPNLQSFEEVVNEGKSSPALAN